MLLIGFLLGAGVALATYTTTIFVDYDSGAVARVTTILGITVRREDDRDSRFAYLPLENGRTGLTGEADWHRALRFRGNQRVSPNYEGGKVLNWIGQIDQTLQSASASENLARLKSEFLEALSRRDFEQAQAVAEKASTIPKKNRSF